MFPNRLDARALSFYHLRKFLVFLLETIKTCYKFLHLAQQMHETNHTIVLLQAFQAALT